MKDISDRKSWGVEWSPCSGLKFRLFNPKGTTQLIHNRTGAGNITETADDPSRFGLTSPPENYNEFYHIAQRWADEAEKMAKYVRNNTIIHTIEGGTRRPDEDTPPERIRDGRLFLGLF